MLQVFQGSVSKTTIENAKSIEHTFGPDNDYFMFITAVYPRYGINAATGYSGQAHALPTHTPRPRPTPPLSPYREKGAQSHEKPVEHVVRDTGHRTEHLRVERR